jgi:hypothetical protein
MATRIVHALFSLSRRREGDAGQCVRPSSVLAGHKSLRELSATDVQLTMG